MFLAADYDRYLLSDANADLVAVWAALQNRPAEFISASQRYFIKENWSKGSYLRIRDEFNREQDRFERAVRFIYLNKFGFNGLFRVNAGGAFNVPYAWPKVLPRFPFEALEAASARLARCQVLSGGFAGTLEQSGFGDAVYCDPPYFSTSRPTFTGYVVGGFGASEHKALVACARLAVERGATVLISNHDDIETRELYRGWEMHTLDVRRSLSASSNARGIVKELLAVLRP